MLRLERIQGLLFDYGGTIDSNGLHWAEVIWKGYEAAHVAIAKETFREAYVYGERTLGKNPIIQPEHTFRDMLRVKIALQMDQLKINDPALSTRVADWCYDYARQAIDHARPVLERLAARYPLALVSNFYGNIAAVLRDFQLDHLFPLIIESAVVGIRKPDPAIFQLGADKLGLPAEALAVVGDSYDKDIVPAGRIGSQTIWLKNIGWKPYSGDETADAVITDFCQLDVLLS